MYWRACKGVRENEREREAHVIGPEKGKQGRERERERERDTEMGKVEGKERRCKVER